MSIWMAADNVRSVDDLKDVTWSGKTSGSFALDYATICTDVLKAVPNPAIRVLKSGSGEDAIETSVQCNHTVIDPCSLKAAMLALNHSKMTKMSFNNCALSETSLELLKEGIYSTQITSLAVDYNGNDTAAAAAALCNLISCSQLTSLSLRGNGIGQEQETVKVLCDALRGNTTLTNLTVYRNELGDEGVNSILRIFRINKSLQHISLGSNGITADCFKNILSSVTRYTLDQSGLEERNALLNTPVADDGGGKKKGKGKGKGSADGASTDEILNKGVASKDKEGNDVEGSLVAAIGTVCRGNTNIVRLDLSYNVEIGKSGSSIIQQFLESSKEDIKVGSLSNLDLKGCGLIDEQLQCDAVATFLKGIRAESASNDESGGTKKGKKK
jgi:hypothetical protein